VKKILLSGEGRNELGGWANEPAYRDPSRIGVLEALLRKAASGGFRIGDAVVWKGIRKYRAGQHWGAETRAVLGLVLDAKERGFDAVAFTRDLDGEKPEHEQRKTDVVRGIEEAPHTIEDAPPIIGGLAVQRLESWILAMAGVTSTEQMKKAQVDRQLEALGIHEKDTAAMVQATLRADIEGLPKDALSLRNWLDRARDVLSSTSLS